MIVNEIFESIQGEGKYCGKPVLFIRLSGCTRACKFCDSKYHTEGKKMSVEEVAKRINKSKLDAVVWTGGEPLMQETEIQQAIIKSDKKYHYLETNGDILPQSPYYFNYICFSPKERKAAANVMAYIAQLEINRDFDWDIKIVTDLKMNKDMINFATLLMPLTTKYATETLMNEQKVWNYCVKHNIKYTPRIHKDVWGTKVGV